MARHRGSTRPARPRSAVIRTCTAGLCPGYWSAFLIVAFVAGGLAIVNHLWLLFWVCLGITVLSVPAGKVVGIMNDTVLAGDPSLQVGQHGGVADDTGSAVDPGVDFGATRAVGSSTAHS